jgi:hypothetical protein
MERHWLEEPVLLLVSLLSQRQRACARFSFFSKIVLFSPAFSLIVSNKSSFLTILTTNKDYNLHLNAKPQTPSLPPKTMGYLFRFFFRAREKPHEHSSIRGGIGTYG